MDSLGTNMYLLERYHPSDSFCTFISESVYSKWTYFPEGQQFTIFFLLVLWSILICWDSELVGFC